MSNMCVRVCGCECDFVCKHKIKGREMKDGVCQRIPLNGVDCQTAFLHEMSAPLYQPQIEKGREFSSFWFPLLQN